MKIDLKELKKASGLIKKVQNDKIAHVQFNKNWNAPIVLRTGPDRPVQPVKPGTGQVTCLVVSKNLEFQKLWLNRSNWPKIGKPVKLNRFFQPNDFY